MLRAVLRPAAGLPDPLAGERITFRILLKEAEHPGRTPTRSRRPPMLVVTRLRPPVVDVIRPEASLPPAEVPARETGHHDGDGVRPDEHALLAGHDAK